MLRPPDAVCLHGLDSLAEWLSFNLETGVADLGMNGM